MSLSWWKKVFNETKSEAEKIRGVRVEELNGYINSLNKSWPENLPSGVIHADLFPDNVFFDDGKISGVIDFYFACNDFFAYDIAICMNAWCFENNGEFNITKARNLLSSYNGVRKISAAELKALPTLAAGAAMRFLMSRFMTG